MLRQADELSAHLDLCVQPSNLTIRMSMKRLASLSNRNSKEFEGHRAKRFTRRTTTTVACVKPSAEVGISGRVWEIAYLTGPIW